MNKKQRNEIIKLPIVDEKTDEYLDQNEITVLEALEDFEKRLEDTNDEIIEKKARLDKLTVLKGLKGVPKSIEMRLRILEDEIEEGERLIRTWYKPSISMLNGRYLEFLEVKFQEQIEENFKEDLED